MEYLWWTHKGHKLFKESSWTFGTNVFSWPWYVKNTWAGKTTIWEWMEQTAWFSGFQWHPPALQCHKSQCSLNFGPFLRGKLLKVFFSEQNLNIIRISDCSKAHYELGIYNWAKPYTCCLRVSVLPIFTQLSCYKVYCIISAWKKVLTSKSRLELGLGKLFRKLG